MTIPGVPPLSAARMRSDRMAAMTRRAIRPLLTHTYRKSTPIAVADGSGTPLKDDWNRPVTAPGAPSDPAPCLYESRTRLVADESGRRLIVQPTLSVYHDDPLAPGDEIVEVQDADGRVILAYGVVDAFDPLSEPGGLVVKEALLRDVIVTAGLAPIEPEDGP